MAKIKNIVKGVLVANDALGIKFEVKLRYKKVLNIIKYDGKSVKIIDQYGKDKTERIIGDESRPTVEDIIRFELIRQEVSCLSVGKVKEMMLDQNRPKLRVSAYKINETGVITHNFIGLLNTGTILTVKNFTSDVKIDNDNMFILYEDLKRVSLIIK